MTAVAGVEGLHETLDQRTLELLRRHGSVHPRKSRGWLVRRALVGADVAGLAVAFGASQQLFSDHHSQVAGAVGQPGEFLVFLACLPAWVVAAKLYGLYDRDEERALTRGRRDGRRLPPGHCRHVAASRGRVSVPADRAERAEAARVLAAGDRLDPGSAQRRACLCRRRPNYLQNTMILGAGDVGQLIARKLRQHPEYGINLVGFVDAQPRTRDDDLEV